MAHFCKTISDLLANPKGYQTWPYKDLRLDNTQLDNSLLRLLRLLGGQRN